MLYFFHYFNRMFASCAFHIKPILQKKSDLSEVAVHGQQLFNAFKAASHLRPHVYNLTASQFIDLYKRCLHAHVRGRNNAGNSLSVGASGALIKVAPNVFYSQSRHGLCFYAVLSETQMSHVPS